MKNTVILLLAKIFEKGIMFLFFILLAREFGKDMVGEFSYYYSIVIILFVLLDLGGEFYQIREFSKRESLKIFNTIFVLKTFIFIFLFSLLIIFKSNIYMLVFFASYYLASIISIFRSSLYAHGHYILESKYTIIEKSIFLIILIVNVMSIESLLVMYFAFLIAKTIYLLILLNKFYKFKYIINIKKLFDIDFAKQYLSNSWSYILHALLVVVFVQIDIIMLKSMGVSYEDIGLYAVALKIYAIAIIFADILFKQYYPIVAKLLNRGNDKQLKEFILKIQSMNLFFSTYAVIITMLFAQEIILLAFGESFIESSQILMFLSIIIIFKFSMYTYTAILSSSNLNHIKLYTSLACVLVNISLNYVLIPIYGVYGAVFATIITELILTISFKISSLRLVFTNYITFDEIKTFIISLVFLSLMFFVELTLTSKVFILIFIIILLVVQIKKIQYYLSIRIENEI